MMVYARWQMPLIEKGLKYRRVLALVGPRQCGKTTLAELLAGGDAIYHTLDDADTLQAALADPGSLVKHGDNLMIIDEVQRVPHLLLAIKRDVDQNKKMGRFLITGSANLQALPNALESLAGRVKKVRLRALAMGEIYGHPPHFIERAFAGVFKPLNGHNDKVAHDKDWYLRLALLGGYPEPREIDDIQERQNWYIDYLEAIIERDLQDIVTIRHAHTFVDLTKVLAAWSSKFMNVSSICATLDISRPTIESYINALEALYLIERVNPWYKTDYDRVGKERKLFMADTGMMSAILGWRFDQIRLNGEINGKLIETFVFNQLMSLISAQSEPYSLYHYRDRQQREVDFILEANNGDLLGIEVKAGAMIDASMFKHLKWFKANMAKKRGFKGIVLYTGEQVVAFGDDLWAVPISCLWSS